MHGADLVSLFFENPDVFDDDLIVDEVLDFFAAGTFTSSMTHSTMMFNCARSPNVLDKIRKEYETFAAKNPIS